MCKITLKSDVESPQAAGTKIKIWLEEIPSDAVQFKFIIGQNGTWETLKDYNEQSSMEWTPIYDGNYIIMAQAKSQGSTRAYDYILRMNFLIGSESESLIQNLYAEKTTITLGEKLQLTVESKVVPALYRYWIKEETNWLLVKDYSAENQLQWSAKKTGMQEVLVECKTLSSKAVFDDFKKLSFVVKMHKPPEIISFSAINAELLTKEELNFKAESSCEDSRILLYKFSNLRNDGMASVLQDFSTKNVVSYVAEEAGEHKLLCTIKDMYSQKEYDDRAILCFNVKPYKKVVLHKFLCDVASPQSLGETMTFKALASGGRELLYRFEINGAQRTKSNWQHTNYFRWKPDVAGQYKITLLVKDKSFDGDFEESDEINFTIEEYTDKQISIKDILLENSKGYFLGDATKVAAITGESIKVTAITKMNASNRYSFVIKAENEIIEKIDYGNCNWTSFVPVKSGTYEIEVFVKDKYSRREYDGHEFVYFSVLDYIPAKINQLLHRQKEYYCVGEEFNFQVITERTAETEVKYKLKINDSIVEEIKYSNKMTYSFLPKCSGVYTIEVSARNVLSENEYDNKKNLVVVVRDLLPVRNISVYCDSRAATLYMPVIFSADSIGGKDVLYEFYIYEENEWKLVQKYSRNSRFGYIAHSKGEKKLLVLAKSQNNSASYEDFVLHRFTVIAT